MHEDILSFLPEAGRDYPFFVEMAGRSFCDGSYRIERNVSQVVVLESVTRGQGVVVAEGEVFQPKTGDTYLLHSGGSHRYWSDAEDPWEKVWVNCWGELAEALLSAYGLAGHVHFPGLDLSGELSELLEAARAAESPDELLPGAALLFHRMAQRMHDHLLAGAAPDRGDAQTLKALLDARVYADADLPALAAQIFRSPSHAIRIFKHAYGVTPYEYLLRRRIETACLLLRNTGLPVKEIAYRLRFSDEHYFSNYFKKRTGQSPTACRRGQSGG